MVVAGGDLTDACSITLTASGPFLQFVSPLTKKPDYPTFGLGNRLSSLVDSTCFSMSFCDLFNVWSWT